MAVRRKSTTLILVGVLVFVLGGIGVLVVLTRNNNTNNNAQAINRPVATASTPATVVNGNTPIGAASLNIPNGMLALALALSSTEAVGGYPVVGDKLDIYGTFKQDQPAHTSLPVPLAKLVFANVKVLAIQEPVPSNTTGTTVVILAVTPIQAESLIYLTTFEGIYTTLVPPGGLAAPSTSGSDPSNILASL